MHFSTIVIALAGVSTAMAAPAPVAAPALMERQASLCTGDYSEQCCATDVLGLADLNCAARKFDSVNFASI